MTNQENWWNFFKTRQCFRTNVSSLGKPETKCKAFRTRVVLTMARSHSQRAWLILLLPLAESTQALEVKISIDLATIRRVNLTSHMTRTLKVKVHPLPKHMSPVNLVQQKLLLKRKRKTRKKLKQNQNPIHQTQIRKTLMKKPRRSEEQQRKQNLQQKLYLSQPQHQKPFQSYKRQFLSQYRLPHSKFNSHRCQKLIPCLIYSQVYQLRCNNHPCNQHQVQVSDSSSQLNNKFSNNNLKLQHLEE